LSRLRLLAGCQTATGPLGEVAGIETAQASQENISSLSAVIQRNPNDPEAYNVRGTAYGRGGRYQEAIADFNRAIELNPRFYQAYANRALIHRFMGDQQAALADYNRALEINSRYDVAYIGRGNLYRLAGRTNEAFQDFERAIQLDTTDARAFHNRGLLYQGRGQHDYAIEDFAGRSRSPRERPRPTMPAASPIWRATTRTTRCPTSTPPSSSTGRTRRAGPIRASCWNGAATASARRAPSARRCASIRISRRRRTAWRARAAPAEPGRPGVNCLVVFAHPLPDSLNGRFLKLVVSELEAAGHDVTLLDLYRLDFDPRLSVAERSVHYDDDGRVASPTNMRACSRRPMRWCWSSPPGGSACRRS
jgi:regulator of sirC expression with transglutaminase-like and TPR domain